LRKRAGGRTPPGASIDRHAMQPRPIGIATTQTPSLAARCTLVLAACARAASHLLDALSGAIMATAREALPAP
jgi:hypothetical protein